MSAIATFMPRSCSTRFAASVALIALSLWLPARAVADWRPPLVVLPASGRGVSAPIIERARHLLVESLGRPGRFRVTDYDRPPSAEGPSADEAIFMARLTTTRLAIAFDISREGAETVFDLHCWDALSGQSACRLREKTAAGPELLPDFTEWIAMRLLRELDAEPDVIVQGDVVSTVSHRRTPRTLTFGARANVMVPVDSPARNTAPLGGIGVLMTADTGSVLVGLGADHQSGTDDRRSWGIGLDLYLPLSDGERLPYVGTGAWLVDQHLGGRGASGLQLRPTLGLLWGRHDVARLRVEAAYFVDLFQERELDRLIPGSGQAHVSHGLMLALGATF